MNFNKGLVLDANILIRAVLGRRVFDLLIKYQANVIFYCPEDCFKEARKYLPGICTKRKLELSASLEILDKLEVIVQSISHIVYEPYKRMACGRVGIRDLNDWPVVAVALAFELAIWTEDKDFFGSGIATWTTDRVEIYLRQ